MRAHVRSHEPPTSDQTTWWGWAYKIAGDPRPVLCVYPSRELAERYTPRFKTTHRSLIPIVIDHTALEPVKEES